MMVVTVTTEPTLRVSRPEVLFESTGELTSTGGPVP